MALHGYAGHVLHLDMSARKSTAIPTEKYRRWGGGHGLGSALFWDFCKDKTIKDGRNPANVCCVCTSPLSGTIVPSATGRCEVVGVAVGQYPQNWYTRSGFGGRFSTMLKFAGWDAIVITGKADKPTWVDVCNDKVTFHDAADLWGKDTWAAQHLIWEKLGHGRGVKSALAGGREGRRRRARRDDTEAGRAVHRAGGRASDGLRQPDPRRGERRRTGRVRCGLGIEEPEGDQRDRHRVDLRSPTPRRCSRPASRSRRTTSPAGTSRTSSSGRTSGGCRRP